MRTHLADEGTFAARRRTGPSFGAGGIAVAQVVPEPARDSGVVLLPDAAFVLLGVAVVAYGARQFARVAGELGRGSRRRGPAGPGVVYALTGVIAVLLLAVLLFLWSHRWSHRGIDRAEAAGGAAASRSS